jgi:hypothetical protein
MNATVWVVSGFWENGEQAENVRRKTSEIKTTLGYRCILVNLQEMGIIKLIRVAGIVQCLEVIVKGIIILWEQGTLG